MVDNNEWINNQVDQIADEVAAVQIEHENDVVLAELIHHLDPNHDDAIFDFNELQLVCYDDFDIICRPCECHGHGILSECISVTNNMGSDSLNLIWQALELELLPIGIYFVAGWVASMFQQFSPIFFDRDLNGLRGMMINVTPESKLSFLHAVARLCDMGVTPCMYMRKMLVFATSATVVLHSEEWFMDVSEISLFWQEMEFNRLYEN